MFLPLTGNEKIIDGNFTGELFVKGMPLYDKDNEPIDGICKNQLLLLIPRQPMVVNYNNREIKVHATIHKSCYRGFSPGLTYLRQEGKSDLILHRMGFFLLDLVIDPPDAMACEVESLLDSPEQYVEHLLERAKKELYRIEFIGGEEDSHTPISRLFGYKNFLAEAKYVADFFGLPEIAPPHTELPKEIIAKIVAIMMK